MLASRLGFATQLRDWRTQRRISQLELALRAGTTQRYVSYVERGRSTPGRAILLRLAEALELPLRERNALLLSAGFAPAFPESPLDANALRPVRDALVQILDGHLPAPALVAGPGGELVAANAAFDVLAEGACPDLLEPPVNVLRLALHPNGMAPRVINLGEWGSHVVNGVRARARRARDPALDALAEELTGYLPSVTPGSHHVGFAGPLRLRCSRGELRLVTTLASFATATDVTLSELHLEAFLPVDEPTAQILRDRDRDRGKHDRPIRADAPKMNSAC